MLIRLRNSAKAGGVLYAATRCRSLAVPAMDVSQLGVADANSILQHGLQTPAARSPGELEMTWSTSDVAVCCSSASVRSAVRSVRSSCAGAVR